MAVKYFTQVVATDAAGYVEVPAEDFNCYAVAAPSGISATLRLGDDAQEVDVTRFPTGRFCNRFGGRVRLQWDALAGGRLGIILAQDADISTIVG